MRTLDTLFTQGRFPYEQVRREGMLALYRQTHRDGGGVRYEVVKIRLAKEHVWPTGAVTPEGEASPGASTWGQLGFTCHSLPEATALFAELQTQQEG